STVTTAILLRASLSLSRHSSSRGPTSRPMLVRKLLRLNPEPNACEINCVKFPNRLMNSSTSRMMANIIQPRLLRGLAGGGGVMIGGGVSGGGTPGEVKDEFSITPAN